MKNNPQNTPDFQPFDLVFTSCEDCDCPLLEQCKRPHPHDELWEGVKIIAPELGIYLSVFVVMIVFVVWVVFEFAVAPGVTNVWIYHGTENAVEFVRSSY